MTITALRPPLVETAHLLADALDQAARQHALEHFHRAGDGHHLATAQPLDLMPHLVEALIGRPDLLRALLAESGQDDTVTVGKTVLGSEAARLPIGSVVQVDSDPGYGDLSSLGLRRVHHVSGWWPELSPDGAYRVLAIGPT